MNLVDDDIQVGMCFEAKDETFRRFCEWRVKVEKQFNHGILIFSAKRVAMFLSCDIDNENSHTQHDS